MLKIHHLFSSLCGSCPPMPRQTGQPGSCRGVCSSDSFVRLFSFVVPCTQGIGSRALENKVWHVPEIALNSQIRSHVKRVSTGRALKCFLCFAPLKTCSNLARYPFHSCLLRKTMPRLGHNFIYISPYHTAYIVL